MIEKNYIKAFWYMSNNFGDSLNYNVLKYVSGKEVVYEDDRQKPHIICCGSIITEASKQSVIWGAGFAWNHDTIDSKIRVIACRGNLSNAKLGNRADFVGDPALIMPKIIPYKQTTSIRHDTAIIPHWKDLEKVLIMTAGTDIHVINPLQPVEDLVLDILNCRMILSSSLHGLILADAYGIPNRWLVLGTDIGGDGFKFLDYYSTVHGPSQPVHKIDFSGCEVHPYKYSIEEYIKSFPK